MDSLTKEKRSWNMSRIRSKDTNPEKQVRSLLHKAGYRFRLHVKSLPGCPDIVLPKYQTAILVHGCFWHRHKDCPNATVPKTRKEFWTSKFEATVKRDQKKETELQLFGWKVVVVWECEIEKDPELTLNRIKEELKGSRNVL
jgi:DNA mismatch endonuclease, patch repair protein